MHGIIEVIGQIKVDLVETDHPTGTPTKFVITAGDIESCVELELSVEEASDLHLRLGEILVDLPKRNF